ncbi:MAG TPA: hypothetical protein VIG75_03435, partial [Citricoccus sp.]
DYVAAYRAGLSKIADLECDILLTPHPSASAMVERMTGAKPLSDATEVEVPGLRAEPGTEVLLRVG